ncbi:MAG TPA: polysaccharide pyruvyl transferase family protein [Noviherbaspirillum sp.]|uniref:polysaccharide pyruvyl transferase family protein n=1 Tax=Noviherbaspirillum sp. TaxID=1926288 RepID=UPI002B472F13|nr:polysaccharide pyruvyl transferase family protein [Noviherbaspirillum sp.]HJV84936.1 polysaccharide pyruvyl transferase family protein [Noviherbaspirillum sp.]
MSHHSTADVPTILFGAFDRHNVGDLLFPHIVQHLLDRKNLIFAGLAERDLRDCGGHQVKSLARLAEAYREQAVNIIHVGGELLTCNAWEAAVMLQTPAHAQEVILAFEGHTRRKLEWAHQQLGLPALAPYSVSRSLFPRARIFYHAVGGVSLDQCDPLIQAEVRANLRAADSISVRDGRTQAILDAAGIASQLVPDPAVAVAELFGERIGQHAKHGEVARVRDAFPKGYLAVQFSADFGDDRTLNRTAQQLDQLAHTFGYGIVFFRAGAAPWHDDLSCYQRTAARMQTSAVHMFESLGLWDICALIACSSAYAGSSLHGRILAMAFGLPRVNLRSPSQGNDASKQEAFAAAWEVSGMPRSVAVDELVAAMHEACAIEREQLRQAAKQLAERHRREFARLSDRID